MTDLNLLQALASGEILYSHRGMDYVRMCGVFALPHDSSQESRFYTLDRDWPATPIGELALRDLEIVKLQQRLASVTAERDTLQAALERANAVPPTIAAAAAGMAPPEPVDVPARKSAKRAGGPVDGGTEKRVRCAECGSRIWPSLLDKHIAEKHAPAPEAELPNPPAWSCAQCGKGAADGDIHTPATLQPDLCLRCNADATAAIKVALGVPADWRCADCGSGDRAQSLRDGQRCVDCARGKSLAPIATEAAQLAA